MSLHSIIEPAGTLLTGWTLVPHDEKKTADVRNKDECPTCETDEGDRTPVGDDDVAPVETRSKWERGEVR